VPLYANTLTLDASAGGVQLMSLDAGLAHAGELFIMAGSLSGTSSGTVVGSLTVPLNVDGYTLLSLTPGSAVPIAPKVGTLDAFGQASVALTAVPGVLMPYIGQTAHHAFVTFNGGYTFASNALPVTIE
jgi:hypothetical protein